MVRASSVDAPNLAFWSRSDIVVARLRFLASESSELDAYSKTWLEGLKGSTEVDKLDEDRAKTFRAVQSCYRDPLPSWTEVMGLDPPKENALTEDETAAMIRWFKDEAMEIFRENAESHLARIREAASLCADHTCKGTEEDGQSMSLFCKGIEEPDTNPQQDEESQVRSGKMAIWPEEFHQPHDEARGKGSDGMGATDLDDLTARIKTELSEHFRKEPWSAEVGDRHTTIKAELRSLMQLATQVIHQHYPWSTHSEQARTRVKNNGAMLYEYLRRCKEVRESYADAEDRTAGDQGDP